MNVMAVIQARLGGATRFGGPKIMADVCGKTVLDHVVERTRRAAKVSGVVVVIPLDPSEDPLFDFCRERGWHCERTQVKRLKNGAWDVLGAYAATAFRSRINPVVRITADCPLIDPATIDAVISFYLAGGYSVVVNNEGERTYPHGMDLEVFSRGALEAASQFAGDDFDREHVSPYIRRHAARIGNVRNPRPSSLARLTVDYPEDLEVVRAIFGAFPKGHPIALPDIEAFLERHPEVAKLNAKRAEV